MLTATPRPNVQFRLSDGLVVVATTDPEDALLRQFFELYDRAFILPSEKEEWDGFVDCLSLNHAPLYAGIESTWGPFREWVLLVRDSSAANAVVGGANLACFALPDASGAAVLSMNLNYIFVVPHCRGRGYLRRITGACQELARRSFDPAPQATAAGLLTFVEQNDPLKLSADEYALDSAHSGIDQVDRIRIWSRLGARIIDFPYAQPALSDDQLSNTGLLLSVIGARANGIDPCVLKLHLERFFAISVLKNRDPNTDAVARQQLSQCGDACRANRPFALLDVQAWLDALGSGPPYQLHGALSSRHGGSDGLIGVIKRAADLAADR